MFKPALLTLGHCLGDGRLSKTLPTIPMVQPSACLHVRSLNLEQGLDLTGMKEWRRLSQNPLDAKNPLEKFKN